jgi:NADPH:quinone reductase-like Zn-dependent oxidoreductase
MKAIVWRRYGLPEVLQMQDVETPVPMDHEVRIKIMATTVTAGDCEMRTLKLPMFLGLPMRLYGGILRPTRIRILGQELAGEIESVGKDVARFKVGERVMAATGFRLGGYAEFICLPEESDDGVIGLMPTNTSFEEAAAVAFGGLEALHFLKKGKIQTGEKVLINGAGGSIGTFGVQLAKHYGAEVTAVDSGPKLDMLRSIGADRVVDYTLEDFTRSGQQYDVIFDVIGKSPFAGSMRSLRPNGRYLLANPRLSTLLRGLLGSRSDGKKVIAGAAVRRPEDLEFLRGLIEAGELKTVIDRTYPLEQMVEAHRYVETGQKAGNLIVTVGH